MSRFNPGRVYVRTQPEARPPFGTLKAKMTWQSIARRVLPKPLRAVAAWRLRHSFRYKKSRESPTDYLAEFDHASLRRAKSSILWFDDWEAATARQMRILADVGVVRDGLTIIDYGCGVGRISAAIAAKYGGRILAVDRSKEMLEHARNYVPRDDLAAGRVELMSDIDLEHQMATLGQMVDTILFIEVLQHIPEPIIDHLLPSLVRALKPTGQLFVFGNPQIDVGADGTLIPKTPTVESILTRHLRIARSDVWTDGFAVPRHSFVCVPSTI